MWSKSRLQTLVASSDGKGKEEKQVPAFRKVGLMKTARMRKAKGDSDPSQFFFFLSPPPMSL